MIKPTAIAHLIATNFYGGPEKQIVTHALRLDKDRFRFVLISFIDNGAPNELVEIARERGVEVIEVHVRNAFDPRTIVKIAAILRNNKIDLLCAHGYKANVIGRLASWFTGIPQIAVSRGWTAENKRIRIYEKLDRWFLQFANHIVAVSEGQKAKIVSYGISYANISVIHNAIDLAMFPDSGTQIRTELGIPNDGVVVASAGRLSPEKNQLGMIEVAKRVVNRNANVYFVIFGEGFLRKELEKSIREAGLESRFFLPGFRIDLQALYHDIDIFMLPSFTEGLPNVALEAFAAKKPIIASLVGGNPEVVQDEVSGYLTSPDDFSAMEARIIKLAADKSLRSKMGEAGQRFVEDRFAFEAQTRCYEQLYERIVTR